MAYSGYLIKIIGDSQTGDYVIPMTLINEASYQGTLSTLDVDAYRDADGVLHRTAVLKVPHVSFSTRSYLTNAQVSALWGGISNRYTNEMQKRVTASVYISEIDDYVQEEFYVPDTELTISHIEGSVIRYEEIAFEFIGYGKRREGT